MCTIDGDSDCRDAAVDGTDGLPMRFGCPNRSLLARSSPTPTRLDRLLGPTSLGELSPEFRLTLGAEEWLSRFWVVDIGIVNDWVDVASLVLEVLNRSHCLIST